MTNNMILDFVVSKEKNMHLEKLYTSWSHITEGTGAW